MDPKKKQIKQRERRIRRQLKRGKITFDDLYPDDVDDYKTKLTPSPEAIKLLGKTKFHRSGEK